MASRRNDPVRARSKGTVSHRTQSWQAWRIADGRFDPFNPVGASLVGGRWNSPGLGVIYASRSYAGAMLECLAHAGIGRVPRTQVALEFAIAAPSSGTTRAACPLVGIMRICAWPEPMATLGLSSGERRYWLCPRSWHAGKGTSHQPAALRLRRHRRRHTGTGGLGCPAVRPALTSGVVRGGAGRRGDRPSTLPTPKIPWSRCQPATACTGRSARTAAYTSLASSNRGSSTGSSCRCTSNHSSARSAGIGGASKYP